MPFAYKMAKKMFALIFDYVPCVYQHKIWHV